VYARNMHGQLLMLAVIDQMTTSTPLPVIIYMLLLCRLSPHAVEREDRQHRDSSRQDRAAVNWQLPAAGAGG
jgi:hypothetical protein